jgi:hypothetical protein
LSEAPPDLPPDVAVGAAKSSATRLKRDVISDKLPSHLDKTMMVFSDAKKVVEDIVKSVE